MFAVRNTSIILQDAKNIIFKVQTKILGRRTVASTEDLSRHCFDVFRSDRPSLFNNQNLFIMRNTKGQSTKSARAGIVPKIKKMHDNSRQNVIDGLYNLPINRLVNDFIVEMDAKNRAYYFILDNGLYDAFRDFCLTSKTQTV